MIGDQHFEAEPVGFGNASTLAMPLSTVIRMSGF